MQPSVKKRCQCFGCHLRTSPESTCKTIQTKRLRIGQQGGCKDANDGASDDPVKILMMMLMMMMMTRMMGKKLTNSGDAD